VTADDAPAAEQAEPYHGRPARRLTNGRIWLDVLAEAGPRIVRLGLAGSARNVLAETPDDGWGTPHGRYELLGGHRLWFAPEDPDRVAVPDGNGLTLETFPDGVVATGAPEPPTGLERSMRVRLADGEAGFELVHMLRNVGREPVELAPWAITQLPLGGTVLLPQAAATGGHHVHPNRMLVLWPYSSWDDARFRPRDGLLTLDAVAGPSLKVGYFNDTGWVGYAHDGALLVRRFAPVAGATHPDLGCNVETYVGPRFLELELLGPLARVEPGATATLLERWELRTTDVADPRAIAEGISAD
jgi:hypothetical protein